MLSSREPSVRLAAIGALGAVGNATTVSLLAGLLGPADRDEQQAIGDALIRLRTAGVDEALSQSLRSVSPTIQPALINVLVGRAAHSAVPVLLELAQASQAEVHRAAIDALGKLGDTRAAQALIRQLDQSATRDQTAIEGALVEICERENTTAPVIEALPSASAAAKLPLIGVLGSVGGDPALAALRREIKASDAAVRLAAVRALCNWQTAAPLDDLAAVAVESSEAQVKALALRGVARMATLAKDRPDEAASAIKRVLPVANNVNERKALLAALGSVASVIALETGESQLAQPETTNEAATAILQVAEVIYPWYRAEVQKAVGRVKAASTSPVILQRADALAAKLKAPANLALGGIATSPDDLEKDGDASGDQAAIDGDLKTYWDEANGQKLYRLRVQLRRPSTVGRLRIVGWQHQSYAARDFEVLCDDQVVKTVKNARYEQNVLNVEFPSVKCSTVELKITGYYGQSPAVRELEIYGPTASGSADK